MSQPEQQTSQERQTMKGNEHVEQILLTFISKIESRLSTLESTLTSQLSELEIKIDSYCGRLNTLEQDVYDDILLPAIQSIIEIAYASPRTGKIKQQLTSITNSIIKTLQKRNQELNQILRKTHIDSTQLSVSSEHED